MSQWNRTPRNGFCLSTQLCKWMFSLGHTFLETRARNFIFQSLQKFIFLTGQSVWWVLTYMYIHVYHKTELGFMKQHYLKQTLQPKFSPDNWSGVLNNFTRPTIHFTRKFRCYGCYGDFRNPWYLACTNCILLSCTEIILNDTNTDDLVSVLWSTHI